METYHVTWSSTGTDNQLANKWPIIVEDETANVTTTSITLTGYALDGFGNYQQENFCWLLENFSTYNTTPVFPTIGQQWYKYQCNVDLFWDGSSWVNNIMTHSADDAPPVNPLVGQMWYNTSVNSVYTQGLNIWNGTVWVEL